MYWIDEGTSANAYSDGAVMKVPAGGGTVTRIASVTIATGFLAVDATHVYWTVGNYQQTNGAIWTASK